MIDVCWFNIPAVRLTIILIEQLKHNQTTTSYPFPPALQNILASALGGCGSPTILLDNSISISSPARCSPKETNSGHAICLLSPNMLDSHVCSMVGEAPGLTNCTLLCLVLTANFGTHTTHTHTHTPTTKDRNMQALLTKLYTLFQRHILGRGELPSRGKNWRHTMFRRVRKIEKSDYQLRDACLSVRIEQLRSHYTGFNEIWYLSIFRKSVEKNSVWILSRITGTLHEDVRTFIISRLILIRMKNVPDKSCRENRNTNFMLNYCFSKIVPFMR